MTKIPSVDELISESRNDKNRIRKKKLIKVLFTLIGLILISATIYFYFQSNLSKLSKIEISGNILISDKVILDSISTDMDKYSILDFGFILSEKLLSNPLLDTLTFNYTSSNELKILVKEFSAIAYLRDIDSILLSNGTIYSLSDNVPISINELIYVTGYEDEVAYLRLTESINLLSSSTKLMISEIIQEEKSYDVYYAKLIMYDGITVYTSLSSLTVLEDYASIRSALNSEHACIAIDEIKSVPYSFSCYP